MGKLVVPDDQTAGNNMGIHSLLPSDQRYPSDKQFMSTPRSGVDNGKTIKARIMSQAHDASIFVRRKLVIPDEIQTLAYTSAPQSSDDNMYTFRKCVVTSDHLLSASLVAVAVVAIHEVDHIIYLDHDDTHLEHSKKFDCHHAESLIKRTVMERSAHQVGAKIYSALGCIAPKMTADALAVGMPDSPTPKAAIGVVYANAAKYPALIPPGPESDFVNRLAIFSLATIVLTNTFAGPNGEVTDLETKAYAELGAL